MNNPPSYIKDLQKRLKEGKFVLKTQQQIEKDFAKFNLFFPDSFIETALTTTEILDLITSRLISFSEEGETRMLQLMYTIDVKEGDFLKLTQEADFFQQLAYMVLEREALKVFLREKFS